MRFYVDIGVNLGLQFIIGLLVLDGLSYPNESHLKYIYIYIYIYLKPNGRIPYDPTQSYIRSYHFCDLATILNFLVRLDRKIVQFYDPDCNFDNHEWSTYITSKLFFMVHLSVLMPPKKKRKLKVHKSN